MIEKIPSQYSFSHTAKDTMAAGVVGLRDCGQQGLPARVRTDHSTVQPRASRVPVRVYFTFPKLLASRSALDNRSHGSHVVLSCTRTSDSLVLLGHGSAMHLEKQEKSTPVGMFHRRP